MKNTEKQGEHGKRGKHSCIFYFENVKKLFFVKKNNFKKHQNGVPLIFQKLFSLLILKNKNRTSKIGTKLTVKRDIAPSLKRIHAQTFTKSFNIKLDSQCGWKFPNFFNQLLKSLLKQSQKCEIKSVRLPKLTLKNV